MSSCFRLEEFNGCPRINIGQYGYYNYNYNLIYNAPISANTYRRQCYGIVQGRQQKLWIGQYASVWTTRGWIAVERCHRPLPVPCQASYRPSRLLPVLCRATQILYRPTHSTMPGYPQPTGVVLRVVDTDNGWSRGSLGTGYVSRILVVGIWLVSQILTCHHRSS